MNVSNNTFLNFSSYRDRQKKVKNYCFGLYVVAVDFPMKILKINCMHTFCLVTILLKV